MRKLSLNYLFINVLNLSIESLATDVAALSYSLSLSLSDLHNKTKVNFAFV